MEKRTSDTHPLSIDAVRCGLGEIGLTLCPGKKGASVDGAPWDRDLASDLALIKEWGPSRVATPDSTNLFWLMFVNTENLPLHGVKRSKLYKAPHMKGATMFNWLLVRGPLRLFTGT
ncbi:MAG: hypothetical protein CMM44_04425 [Rhodospirillaceae bacterium]|nr:hypothetical protein [Rhodospirillaceae bacterium]|tara:strand:+ start:605 stop:955 length:351 start_codon:yes stop_codon:yes gene_type:complete